MLTVFSQEESVHARLDYNLQIFIYTVKGRKMWVYPLVSIYYFKNIQLTPRTYARTYVINFLFKKQVI